MEAAVKKLSEVINDRNAPASAKVAAASHLLDRVAGKPKFQDEHETEQSQFERMSAGQLISSICSNLWGLSSEARGVIAEALLSAERGIRIDTDQLGRDFDQEAASTPAPTQGLPALESKRPKKEPRR